MRALSAAFTVLLAVLINYSIPLAQEDAMDQPEQPAQPQITLGYIYVSCNDIAAMRRFYVELLGMPEQSYQADGEVKWLVCQCRGCELMFFAGGPPLAVPDGWHAQPGWEGGTLEGVSWSVEVPLELYAVTVQRLLDADVEHFFDKPQWFQDTYWGFPVKDPQGNTVEVFCLPATRPASTVWP
jgi:catechol 2,3-dioxygenase-like lactoylglutathione lyase family enzyme